MTFVFAGYDPSIQVLSASDFADAVARAIDSDRPGIYNVAPREVIPLHKALRQSRTWRIPVPRTMQRPIRAIFARLGLTHSMAQFEFIRYSWTVSNRKIADELGFRPSHSSTEALREVYCKKPEQVSQGHAMKRYDDFGMDEQYIRSIGHRQLWFTEKCYWRIEVDGLKHLPSEGAAVLTGLHRGFMPFDGVMMVHIMSKYKKRIPRFLIHPALVKFPHLARFLTRLGGIIACKENADLVLGQNEIVGIFPEGIRGAFRMYDHGNTYQLGKFRADYVKIALARGVPIIPFVAIGPAEIFPIFGKIEWSWWKRQTHWPFFPITATWPLLPIPLPSKWHIKILPPIDLSEYSPDAANDRKTVRKINHQVRDAMQAAIDEMLSQRKRIFFGSVFKHNGSQNDEVSNLDRTKDELISADDAPSKVLSKW